MEKSAELSEDRQYRYMLRRSWDWQGYANQVMFIGLNPSTADETEDDPTIRRCIRFAQDWGYGGLLMLNAYALRATDPKKVAAHLAPIGPDNDEALSYRATQAGLFIACWGAHCSPTRASQVCELIGRPIHCLGQTQKGAPRHPLYMPADSTPEPYWSPSGTFSTAAPKQPT